MSSSANRPTEELWQLTATQILPLLLQNQVTVEQYAKSLLSRIQDRDEEVKAWVYLNPELIIAQARQLDAIPLNQRGPLHGIAIGVKDNILTADMPTQYNSPIYYSNLPSSVDANCVRILRAFGALIFGKTTTTEFAATSIGNCNQNFTRNAHAANRTPGGSSSGSGAAVADFQVPIALGTQTGGSVIRPASFNGVWGIKYTWGAVSNEGVGPYSVTCDTLGSLARSTEDLELISRVLRVEDDDMSSRTSTVSLKGAKIAFCRTHVWDAKAGPNLKSIWNQAKVLLQKAGAEIEDLELPGDFARVSEWHANMLAGEGRNSFLGTYLLGKENLAPSLQGYVDNRGNVSRRALSEAHDGCARLRPVWDKVASGYAAVITPSVPDEAPLGLDSTGDAVSPHVFSCVSVSNTSIVLQLHVDSTTCAGR